MLTFLYVLACMAIGIVMNMSGILIADWQWWVITILVAMVYIIGRYEGRKD